MGRGGEWGRGRVGEGEMRKIKDNSLFQLPITHYPFPILHSPLPSL
ncbi:MAG: hypothetical protein KME31_21895 [Tolypothrix carrinoi HA7290-LM1]|nr:hypothetical protein [Tolypothrix carrinoi HA7290-LM1]